jgi:osmoprotectant transport system ATP-binding protein
LLRIMLGLIWPDSGQVVIGGTQIRPDNIRQFRRNIGYVTQVGGLFPHLSNLDNILLAARYFGVEAKARTQLDSLMEMTELSPDLLERFPAELSGGQRQRVSLIRALILEPSLILLDEPMAALDPMIRAELQTDLKRIFSELKKTVILVTHDVAEAAFLGDQIVLMYQGQIAQQGSFAELLHHPKTAFVTDFLAAQRTFIYQAPIEIAQGAEI